MVHRHPVSMLYRPSNVGQQLRSIAHRYCGALPKRYAGIRVTGLDLWGHQESPVCHDESNQAEDAASKLARLEAILFLSREPLSTRKLSQYADLTDGTEARTLIGLLNDRYDDHERAFRVEQVAGGYQLLTRAKFADWLRRLEHTPPETRLSVPAMETLAVVAYRQPVLRADVEAIRGVSCGEILRQLMDRDLVRIGGRSDELGRPFLYATTKRFLQSFGLGNLDQLPSAEVLRNAPVPPTTQPVEETTEESAIDSLAFETEDS